MSEYNITKEQLKIANKLGVMIYPADPKHKTAKIEIYDSQGLFMYYIGDKRYNDYFIYKQGEKDKALPKGYAKWRRSLYLSRHERECNSLGTRGWFSCKILWGL